MPEKTCLETWNFTIFQMNSDAPSDRGISIKNNENE